MKNITDDSIKRLIEVIPDKLIIPNQDGLIFREGGNPLEMGDDIILLYTMNSKVGYAEQWLYYSYCNKNDLTNWKHMGRLKISGMAEDPYLLLKSGKFTLKAEDRNKPEKYSICQHHSTNWDYKTNAGTWQSDGTIYEHPGGAMYSPLFDFEDGKEFNFAEERCGSEYKNINIVDADTRKILIHYTDDLNVVVTDYIYKINNKYEQFFHSYHVPSKTWVHNIATSDKLLSGWKILPQLIKPIGIIPIYLDKWHYLVQGENGLYLGIPKTKQSNGGNMKIENLHFDESTKVLSCDDIPEAIKFSAFSTFEGGQFQYDAINYYEFIRKNGRILFDRIHSKFYKEGITQVYWITAELNGEEIKSNKLEVKRGDVVIPDSDDNIAKLTEAERLISEVRESLM